MGTRGRLLSKKTLTFQILVANFKFQLNFMQISYFRSLYFKFLGKFHINLTGLRFDILVMFIKLYNVLKKRKDKINEVS